MSNTTLQCTSQDECPGPQLCRKGACECFWRYGLTGDACDQWTARAAWHVTGRTLSLAIFLAAGLHTALVLTKATGYQCRRTRSILGACAPSRILCTLWSALAASAFGCAHFSFSLAATLSAVEVPIPTRQSMLRVTEGELVLDHNPSPGPSPSAHPTPLIITLTLTNRARHFALTPQTLSSDHVARSGLQYLSCMVAFIYVGVCWVTMLRRWSKKHGESRAAARHLCSEPDPGHARPSTCPGADCPAL